MTRLSGAESSGASEPATSQEVAFLLDALRLNQSARVLDVGCGSGRHLVALSERGLAVTGVDTSSRLLALAAEGARAARVRPALFEVDARQMPFDDEFDAVISLSRGRFGPMGGGDALVLRRMAEAARPGGRVAVTVGNAYFAARNAAASDLDVNEGRTRELERSEDGDIEVWTSVYTPRELRLLAIGVGLVPEDVWAVEAGAYARRTPDAEHRELMLVAKRPG